MSPRNGFSLVEHARTDEFALGHPIANQGNDFGLIAQQSTNHPSSYEAGGSGNKCRSIEPEPIHALALHGPVPPARAIPDTVYRAACPYIARIDRVERQRVVPGSPIAAGYRVRGFPNRLQ